MAAVGSRSKPPIDVTTRKAQKLLERIIAVAIGEDATELELEHLYVVEELPASISRLTNLRRLDLGLTRIKHLAAIAKLTSLEELSVGIFPEGDNKSIDIGPLTQLPKLRRLVLSGPDYLDISPLAKMASLDELSISHTQLKKIDPIGNLSQLRRLDLIATRTKDFSPLAGLNNLIELNLSQSSAVDLAPFLTNTTLEVVKLVSAAQCEDISALSNKPHLRVLLLQGTKVHDLEPLSSLRSLQVLELDHTKITHVSALKSVASLTDLSLRATRVKDLSPLFGLRELRSLRLDECKIFAPKQLSRFTGLTALYLHGSDIVDVTGLSALKQLRCLALGRSNVTDLAALAELTSLVDGAVNQSGGLSYEASPISLRLPFRNFVKLDQPACTIETINYLRQQAGLDPYVSSALVSAEGHAGSDLRQTTIDTLNDDTLPPLGGPTAASRFVVVDGHVDVVISDSWNGDETKIARYYDRAKTLAGKLSLALDRTDAARDIHGSVSALIENLGDDFRQMQPDQLRLAWRSIAARARAYGHPNAEGEVSVETVAILFELSDVLVDLQRFANSEIAENERAIRAINLSAGSANDAKVDLDGFATVVASLPEISTSETRKIFRVAATVSHTSIDVEAKIAIEAERMLTVENLALAVARNLAGIGAEGDDVAGVISPKTSAAKPRGRRGLSATTTMDEFSRRYLDRLAAKGPEKLADATVAACVSAIKTLPKTIVALGGLLVIAFLAAPWVASVGGLAVSLAWIGYELRKRFGKTGKHRGSQK